MYSSTYYKNQVNKYKNIKSKLQNKIINFDNTIDRLNYANQFFLNQNKLMMIGEQLDGGGTHELLEEIKNARSCIVSIIDECDQKIAENEELYRQAIANELENKEEGDENEY